VLFHELSILPEHPSSPPDFSGVQITRFLILCVIFFRWLFALWFFFFCQSCCLPFFHVPILITPLISSNSSSLSLYFGNVSFNLPLVLLCFQLHQSVCWNIYWILLSKHRNNPIVHNIWKFFNLIGWLVLTIF
jgi:hypothetical protein